MASGEWLAEDEVPKWDVKQKRPVDFQVVAKLALPSNNASPQHRFNVSGGEGAQDSPSRLTYSFSRGR